MTRFFTEQRAEIAARDAEMDQARIALVTRGHPDSSPAAMKLIGVLLLLSEGDREALVDHVIAQAVKAGGNRKQRRRMK